MVEETKEYKEGKYAAIKAREYGLQKQNPYLLDANTKYYDWEDGYDEESKRFIKDAGEL